MPTTPVLTLAAVLLGLAGPPAEFPTGAVVVARSLGAYLAPDAATLAPERLHRGDRVRVVDADGASGWLTVEPPHGAFSWVQRPAIKTEKPGWGRVVAERTTARAGVAGARMPGPPRAVLDRGASVTLLDRPPLVVGSTTWVAIAPTPGDVRYVRTEGVAWERDAPASASASRPEPSPETRAVFEPGPAGGAIPGLAPALAAEVAQAEAEHRAALTAPVERWQLDAVRRRYEALARRVTDPAQASALRERIDRVAAHEEIARSARRFQALLERSRRRDREVATVRRQLAEVDRPQRRPFVAEGLVQASSREVDGRRVYALIGPEGSPIAYLDVPPGLDARHVLARRAGVRGTVRYSETLGARLIAVRDLEPLE